MEDRIRSLLDYPDISFIGDWNLDKWEQQIIGWYEEKYAEVTGKERVLQQANWQRLMLQAVAYITFIGMKQIEFNGKNEFFEICCRGISGKSGGDEGRFPTACRRGYGDASVLHARGEKFDNQHSKGGKGYSRRWYILRYGGIRGNPDR